MKVVILAKSDKKRDNKQKGCCVAGRTETGCWIRLVADANGDSLAPNKCNFNTLDVIDVEVTNRPIDFQPENAILKRWSFAAKFSIYNVLESFDVDNDDFLFVDNKHFLDEKDMPRFGSLMMVNVKNLSIYKDENDKVKALFTYNGYEYKKMSVTAPNYYKPQKINEAYIVISIPHNPFVLDERCLYYKFIAEIYPV